MRLALRFFLLLAAVAPAFAADGITFVRVWPAWRDAAAFDSISEHFTGREEHGHRVVQRTTPDQRAGFYYLVRVRNEGTARADARFSLQVVSPASPETKTYAFPALIASGTTVFQLGLTGPEWPDRKAHPVAWKLELLSADGRVLASEQSFLWAKPSK
jgi:hypothetical protein